MSANSYQNKPFQATNPKILKANQKRPDVFNYINYDTQGIKLNLPKY